MLNNLESLIFDVSIRVRMLKEILKQDQESKIDLTDRELLLLGLVSTRGKTSLTELDSLLHNMSRSTISATINSLWNKKGLITKVQDEINPRTINISLSDKGIKIYKKNLTKTFKVLVESLQLKDEELIVLEKVLKRAIAYFDKELGFS